MRRNALQPVIQPTDIHGSRSDNVLKMGARLSKVARTPPAHPTHSLCMNPFYACSLSILMLKLFRLLPLTSSI